MTDDEAFLRLWVTKPRGEREMSEFNQTFGRLIPDPEAVQETVEIGLSFERASKAAEDGHQQPVRGLPAVRGVTVPVPAGSVFSEKK